LDYYEFIDKVFESDYKTATGKKISVRPATPPRRMYPGQVTLYRQMLRLKEMFKFNDEDDTHSLGPDELTFFLKECGHKEPDEEQVAEIMQALDRDKNGTISFEELWDWWVEYCMEAGTLHGTGLKPPLKEWQLFQQDVSEGTGLATDLHDVVDMKGAMYAMKKQGVKAVGHRNNTGFLQQSPRDLIKKGSSPGMSPRPPPSHRSITLPAMPTVPKLPTSPGFKTVRPAMTQRHLERPTTQGGFSFENAVKSGQPFSPRAYPGSQTARMAPQLSPLLRNRPLTHRGPATSSSGFKV